MEILLFQEAFMNSDEEQTVPEFHKYLRNKIIDLKEGAFKGSNN